jgi:transcriptional regulator with XRE-family HTH domain
MAGMKNLKQRRLALGLPQSEIARRVRCSTALISLLETGKQNLTQGMRQKIEAALNEGPGVKIKRKQQQVRIPVFATMTEAEAAEMHRIWLDRYGN